MSVTLMARQERECGHGVRLDTPNEQLGQNAPDHHPSIRRSESRIREEHEDQGTVAKRPSGMASGHTYYNGHPGGAAHHTVQYGRSSGKCRRPGDILPIHI